MKGLKYISIILMILLIITGCGKEDIKIDEENEEHVEKDYIPAQGGTLLLSTTRFKTLNPLFNKNSDMHHINNLIYESLVMFKEDMSIEPLLAEKWIINDEEQSIDFTLKDNITWHDGKPLVPEDVIFTFNVIKGNIKGVNKVSIYKNALNSVSGIEKIGDKTIRVKFTKDIGNGLETMVFPILPEHTFGENNVQLLNEDKFHPVGTGKYVFKEYQEMRYISLQGNDNYWGIKPYIDDVNIRIVPDEEAQLSLFENRDIDLIYPKVIDWGKYADEKTTTSTQFYSSEYNFIGVNFRKSLLQNLEIRKAIAYSIDRDKIISSIYYGHSKAVDFPIVPNSWLYSDSKDKIGFNPNMALDILEKSGYVLNKETGLVEDKEGKTIELKLITNGDNTAREQTALLIKEDLKNIGILLEVEALEWEELTKRINSTDYDLILSSWELSNVPNLTTLYHSKEIGGSNFIGYNNEELDILLDSSLISSNLEFKKERFAKISEHIALEIPYISLFFQNSAVVTNEKIKGDIKSQNFNIYYNIEDWFIKVKE